MTPSDRKKVAVIAKYATESFSESDWYSFGQITGSLKAITDHPRLLRAWSFGDDDYESCAVQVLDDIFKADSSSIDEVIDHFDIDLWYSNKAPEKHKRIFASAPAKIADFWGEGYVKAFISHLSSNRARMSGLKANLSFWGISAFVAHEDIQASREWREEVEAGLETMEILIAVVEPGFKESDWCAQEVGYALGRRIDIIPLRAGMDPFGFFGKYQGIQIKGKHPKDVASEIVQTLLKKPGHRDKLMQSLSKALSTLSSEKKIEQIQQFESWSIATEAQIKEILERASLSEFEKKSLRSTIDRVGAFKATSSPAAVDDLDDIPF